MNNSDLSIRFYQFICDVIGTEDVVSTRRRIFSSYDRVVSSREVKLISSGSKAEGLDLEGSDLDVMLLWNMYPVHENDDQVKFQLGILPFVMETLDCKTGYTLIRQHNCIIIDSNCVEYAGKWYLSSEQFRDMICSNEVFREKFVTHGPCKSDRDGTMDYASCLRSQYWISQAQSWLSRVGNSWASNNVIDAIIEFGILFVPVGCKNSKNIDLEWRISFSYAEKLLIWSFNHVQFLCYALLKILLKDIIKHITGDLLCSYFLKTIMFWICEETTTCQWEAKAICSCFMRCLDRLIYCVEYKTCVHFFIPENDLFAGRFDKQQHRLLLSVLKKLRDLGWICLLQTKTLASFNELFVPAASPIIPKVLYLKSLDHLDVILPQNILQQLKQNFYFCIRAKTKDIYMYTISLINRIISQNLLNLYIINFKLCLDPLSFYLLLFCNNKFFYNIYRRRQSHLLIGLNNDAVSGWFLLASNFYICKQYNICKHIVSECLLKCTPEKIVLSCTPTHQEEARVERLQNALRIGRLSLIRKLIMNHVRFIPFSEILPEELLELDIGAPIFVPPVIYGYILKLFCAHQLYNREEINESIRALEFVVQKRYFIVDEPALYYERACELLTIAYSFKSDTN